MYVPTNEPTNTTNSFNETVTANTVNLGVNSLQTESKAHNHSRDGSDRTQG